jgi:CheY-like chemotaxis protein
MSILVVEDNPLSATVLENHLARQGWGVLHAANGRAALAVLEREPDVEVLITDIQMPEMDGIELIQALRARPEWKALPVLVATARASSDLVTRAAALGVRHLVVKPYNVSQLMLQVREVLRAELPTLRSRQHVQVTLGVDAAAYGALLRSFDDMAAARLVELDAFGAGGAAAATELGSHLVDLRESASLIGADRVVVALDAVLVTAREARDVAGLAALGRELQRVRAAVGRASPQTRGLSASDDVDPIPDEPDA